MDEKQVQRLIIRNNMAGMVGSAIGFAGAYTYYKVSNHYEKNLYNVFCNLKKIVLKK
jgi:ribosomal protein S26